MEQAVKLPPFLKQKIMIEKSKAQKILIEKIKSFIQKNRCSLPNDDILELENCIKQFEVSSNGNHGTESRHKILTALSRVIEILVKYFLFNEMHNFFDN